MTKILFFLEKYLAAFLILLLGHTLRFRISGSYPETNVIYAFWHRNMLPLLYLRRNEQAVILISSSKDGELVAGPAKALGYQTARGSSRRGRLKAMKEMIEMSGKHSLAVTPDGPKGPLYSVRTGLLQLAHRTNLPLVPIAVDIKREIVLNSWDKFRIPLPFTRVNITYGEAYHVKTKDAIRDVVKFQQTMMQLTERNKIR